MEKHQSKNQFIYGIHPVIEALREGKTIEKIFLQKELKKEGVSEIFRLAKESEAPLQMVPEEKLNRLVRGAHQGVVAIVSSVSYISWEDVVAHTFEKGETPLLLMCDRVTDVRNMGAMARTAYAGGVQAMIVPQTETAAITPDAIKSSAGALQKINLCREKNLSKVIDEMKLHGIQSVAADMRATKYVYEVDLKLPTVIIMGSEGEGIDKNIIRKTVELVKLPMMGDLDSYNVSVAAGMMIYEALRQRM
jgi:23S rRNA (guanosine2251-2'-O)-methyltransferase